MGNQNRFLRLPAVMERTGYGRSTIYEMIGAGNCPAPVHLGPRAVAWLESEVDSWMQERIDARNLAA